MVFSKCRIPSAILVRNSPGKKQEIILVFFGKTFPYQQSRPACDCGIGNIKRWEMIAIPVKIQEIHYITI